MLTDVRSFITVTLDESNRTWGRSTIYKPEEFDDVKKGIKKKGRTWGPSSVQTKERGNCAERYRTLVFISISIQYFFCHLHGVCVGCLMKLPCPGRVRPLSDGNNPWSTSLVKSQKSVPLAALFAEQQGEGNLFSNIIKYNNTIS